MAKSHSHGFSDDVVRMWDELYDQAQQSYADLKQLKTTRNKNIIAEGEEEAAAQYYAFLRIMLGTLRQMWAQFDPVLILAGLAIMLLSLTSLSLVYWRSQQSSLETIASKTLAGSAAGGIIGLVASKALDTVLSATAASSHASQLDLAVVGLTVGALGSFCFQALVNYQAGVGIDDTSPPGFWRGIPVVLNGVAILVTLFHFLVFTSNSYTFNEDSVVLYLLQTLTLVLFGAALSTLASKPETQQAAGQRAAICAFAILVLNRISSYSTVCREEQIPGGCKPTFYGSESASISSVWLAVANLGMVWIVPSVVLRFLRRSRSDTASVARLWLGIGMRASMGMAAVYWILDSIDAEAALEPKASGGNWSELRILLARTSVGIALGGGLAAWLASPFCLDVAIADASTTKAAKHKKQAAQPKRTAIILGFGNAYGVAYLLFVTVVFCVLYLVQQPMGGIMLSVLFVEILLAMELFDALHDALQCSMSLVPAQVVMLGLLSYMGYFATGHQFTLVSLQWSTAFVGVREMQLVVCGVIVGLNTLGAFVLGAMGVPLVALWNQSLGTQLLRIAPGNFMARVTGAAAAYLAYHAAVSTSSAIFAAVFRRHLMVWKVFAPRFMFSVPVLLGSVVLALCLAVGFAAVRVLRMGLGVGSAQSLVADRIRAK
ncbi:mannose-ethanolamine phosphotransferase gpi13 [Linderina pennispora]|nr:mannose-ethanolamine phosphotransferase gpi13 [Linderina pennispora]